MGNKNIFKGTTMKKTTIAILVALGLSTAAFAFGPGGHGCGDHDKGREMFQTIKQLDLTSDQKDALGELKKSFKSERQAKRKEMKENFKSMREGSGIDMSSFMSADKFDKESFKAQMNTKSEQRRAKFQEEMDNMMDKKADGIEKVFNILTPEQRKKWIELNKQDQ